MTTAEAGSVWERGPTNSDNVKTFGIGISDGGNRRFRSVWRLAAKADVSRATMNLLEKLAEDEQGKISVRSTNSYNGDEASPPSGVFSFRLCSSLEGSCRARARHISLVLGSNNLLRQSRVKFLAFRTNDTTFSLST